MTTFKAPKPYKLLKVETITSFETWKHNQLYNIQSAEANRGLTDDADTIAAPDRKSSVQKCVVLNMLLDQIASWCPFISRTFIVKQSTSLNDVWQRIREHYGFLLTGSQFLDLSMIKYGTDYMDRYRVATLFPNWNSRTFPGFPGHF